MRWRFLFGLLGGVWGAAVFAGGCGDGAPAPRGFASRQAVHLQDATFTFVGYSPGSVLYGTGDEGTRTYWQLDAETGTLTNLGASPSSAATGAPPARFSCATLLTDTGGVLTITDTQTGVVTTVDDTAVSGACPTEADPSLTVWRHDATGHLLMWSGRYDDLQPVALPLLVDQVISLGTKATRVTAERPDAPGNIGIYDIDDATNAVSEVVPPTLGAATWAEGATPVGPLASTSVVDPAVPYDISQLGNSIFYQRTMSDGGTVLFVSSIPPAPAGELALFRVDGGATLIRVGLIVAGGNVPSLSPAWLYWNGSTALLFLWDAQTGRLISCPGADELRPQGFASPDGRQFLVGIQSSPGSPAVDAASVVLISPDGNGRDGTCTVLAADHSEDPQMSPDGALTWLVDAPGQRSVLWTAAGDGTGAREIGQGSIDEDIWPPYFYAPSRLELRLDSDLAWVDVRDDPVKMHYVAEQVFDQTIDYDRQVVIGYDFSAQDGTGSLGLVDRDTGAKRLISSQVVTYERTRPSSSDSPVADYIVYLVRGRNPSSQDGLWVATISKNDVGLAP